MDKAQEMELIDRCLNGETACFATLVRRYEPMVRTMIARLLPDSEDVDELAHETFLRAWEKLDRFERRCKFSTWLGQIALNKARDRLRVIQRQRNTCDIEDVAHELAGDDRLDPYRQVCGQQAMAGFRRALASLSPGDQALITLRYLFQQDLATTARELAISPELAKVRSFRARASLRAAMSMD